MDIDNQVVHSMKTPTTIHNTTSTVLLHEIADILTGYIFRQSFQKYQGDLNAFVLQITQLNKSHVTLNNLGQASLPSDAIKYRLQNNDILIASRGNDMLAALYTSPVQTSTSAVIIPTSQIYMIRAKTEYIIPEYLQWQLNQCPAQHYIKTRLSSGKLPTLNKRALYSTPVRLPSFKAQRNIARLESLWKQERNLTHEILTSRQQEIQAACNQLLQH